MIDKLFFDALGVNIKVDDDDYFLQLKEFAKELTVYLNVAPSREGKSHNSYLNSYIWETEQYTLFLNHTGYTKGMGMFLEVKGYSGCKLIAQFFNQLQIWKWSVTRADVALDFRGKTIFGKLKDRMICYAKVKGIDHLNTQGDWINCVRGRTLYVGSKKSEIQFRLYEKSEEQWQKGNAAYPADMVRLEVQIRPTKRQRTVIKELTPTAVLAINRNVSGLYGELVSTAIDPVSVPKQPEKSDIERLNYAVDQYYSIIDRIRADIGIRGLAVLLLKRLALRDKLSKK